MLKRFLTQAGVIALLNRVPILIVNLLSYSYSTPQHKMSQNQLVKSAWILMLAPSFAVYAWQAQSEYAELRAMQPHQLPGEFVKFDSLNCNGSREMLPIIQEIQNERYRLTSIDLEKNPAVANKFHVRSLPAFI